jgi:MFS family permease
MTAVLAVPEFRALWIAEGQSVAGDQLTRVALAILVYTRTNSALWAATVYALTFLPALAGGLGLSQLADRFSRRRLIVTCTTLQGVLVGIMAIPGTPLLVLCALVVAANLVQAPAHAAQNAVTRELFDSDELYLRSQDLRGITTNTVRLLGLAGGGLLVAGIGTSWALAIDALTFLLSALLVLLRIKERPVAGSPQDGWFGAIRVVFGDHRLRVMLTLAWLVGLVVVPEGLAAPLAKEIGAGGAAVGWLLAADPFGFVIGTFVLSRFVGTRSRVAITGVLATGSAGVLIAFVAHPGLTVALVLLALAGAFGAYQIAVSATFNTLVPNEIRGGAIGVARTGLRVAQGVGVALGGLVAQLIGSAANTIAIAGALGVVIAIPATISWARIMRNGLGSDDRPPPAATPAERPVVPTQTNGKHHGEDMPQIPRVRMDSDPVAHRRETPKS